MRTRARCVIICDQGSKGGPASMPKTFKTHTKYKGKALCGAKRKNGRLAFVESEDEEPTCGNCRRAKAK